MYNGMKLEVEKVEIVSRTSFDCLNKLDEYIRNFCCENFNMGNSSSNIYTSARSYVDEFSQINQSKKNRSFDASAISLICIKVVDALLSRASI